jgi:hypothetical protein
MSKDPAERWPTGAFFLEALRGRLDPEAVQTISLIGRAPPPATASSRKSLRRRAWLFAVAALAVVLAVTALNSVRPRQAPSSGTTVQSAALLLAARRAMDEGAYLEARQMAELALKLAPENTEARAAYDRVERAWAAEKSLGLWQAVPASPSVEPSPTVDARSPGGLRY